MTIDATAGGATSDSFATVAEANSYHNSRLHNDEWFNSPLDTREKALKWATRMLDNLSWKGQKTATTQALKWPRTYVYNDNGDQLAVDEIPSFLIAATSEYAWELIKSDREVDSDSKGISEVWAGEVVVKFNSSDRATKTPTSVYRLISYYTTAGSSSNFVRIERA